MKLKIASTTLCLLLALMGPISTALANEGVAKAIIVKGKVTALLKDGKSMDVAKDTWLPEGAKVSTATGSFAKLLFIDKSSMNVGPSSVMEIASFPKSEPGVINLLQGEVRSKVTKNYMDMKDKDKSKLFIKTKTAAMGVRGTDFIVGVKPGGATSLDVVSGIVAMAPIDPSINNVDQRALENVVSSPTAVMVEKGFSSEVGAGATKAAEPTPIPASKLENLNSNENALTQSTPSATNEGSESKGQAKEDKSKSETAKADNKTPNDTDKSKDKKPDEQSSGNSTAAKKEDAPKQDAPKTASSGSDNKPGPAPAPAAPVAAVLPPGLSASMANAAPVGGGGGGGSDDGGRSPASMGPAPMGGQAPPPPPQGGNFQAPPPVQVNMSDVQAPQCKDLCQCYGIGCNVAAAGGGGPGGGGGGAVGNLDGNALGTISNQIQSNISDAVGSGQLPSTATVKFNITTQ